MSGAEIKGRFVWHDLMTSDTAAAGKFYPRVTGWKSQAWEKDASYTLWMNGKNALGGVVGMPKDMGQAPAHWMMHVATPNVAATVETARSLGARICKEVTPIPDVGQFAVIADPQGATFSAFQPNPMPEGSTPPSPKVGEGDFCWHELATTEPDAALSFYTELFGWKLSRKHDMAEMGSYTIFAYGGEDVGGIYQLQPGIPASFWLSYIRVKDASRAAKAASAGGGRVINGPMEVPGGALIAQFTDPQGALFAVHQLKPVVKAKSKEAAPPREEVETRAPAKKAKPAPQRAAAVRRRPAKKKAAPAKPGKAAKKSAAASKRVAPRRAAKKSRAKAKAAKRTSSKRASAARKRPASRKSVSKKKVTRRSMARKHR